MTQETRNFRGLLCLTTITLASSLPPGFAGVETIYKSVDAQGNVTLSDTPPVQGVEAQQIAIQPGPTSAQQQESIEAEQRMEKLSNEIPYETLAAGQSGLDVQPTTVNQQGSGDDGDPLYVDGGYLGDGYRDERLREGVNGEIEARAVPAYAPRGRVR